MKMNTDRRLSVFIGGFGHTFGCGWLLRLLRRRITLGSLIVPPSRDEITQYSSLLGPLFVAEFAPHDN